MNVLRSIVMLAVQLGFLFTPLGLPLLTMHLLTHFSILKYGLSILSPINAVEALSSHTQQCGNKAYLTYCPTIAFFLWHDLPPHQVDL